MYVISQHNYVSFTDNLSVPQTMDYSVNQGFAKLVSSTDNSSTPFLIGHTKLQPPTFVQINDKMAREKSAFPSFSAIFFNN